LIFESNRLAFYFNRQVKGKPKELFLAAPPDIFIARKKHGNMLGIFGGAATISLEINRLL